jgi:hypothetical protein
MCNGRKRSQALFAALISLAMLSSCSIADDDTSSAGAADTSFASESDTSADSEINREAAVYLRSTEDNAYSPDPFTSYTLDYSDGSDSYMITIALDTDNTSFNVTTENSSFEYSDFNISPPENYGLNIPYSRDDASSVCKVIKNTVDDAVMPDILQFTFYLNNFDEDEERPYTIYKFYAVKDNSLAEISLLDENGDAEPYYNGSTLLHTESDVFMPYPQLEIDADGNISGDVYTYTFSYDDMTMTKEVRSCDFAESPLYFGYYAYAAAGYVSKYFTTTSLDVTDYENYIQVPSVNSDVNDYFFKVDDPRFSTTDDLKSFLRMFFSEKIANELFVNAPQKYRDIDGELYTIVGDGGADFTLGDLTITSWEEDGSSVTYHTKQEKFDEDGKFKEFIDGGDFTVEISDNGFIVTQYRISY